MALHNVCKSLNKIQPPQHTSHLERKRFTCLLCALVLISQKIRITALIMYFLLKVLEDISWLLTSITPVQWFCVQLLTATFSFTFILLSIWDSGLREPIGKTCLLSNFKNNMCLYILKAWAFYTHVPFLYKLFFQNYILKTLLFCDIEIKCTLLLSVYRM